MSQGFEEHETRYYLIALAIAVALKTARLRLAMMASRGNVTRFVQCGMDEIVAAARNGWSVVVYAVPRDLDDVTRIRSAIEMGTAHWLGDYHDRQPACGDLLWMLHTEFTGELPPKQIEECLIAALRSPWPKERHGTRVPSAQP